MFAVDAPAGLRSTHTGSARALSTRRLVSYINGEEQL